MGSRRDRSTAGREHTSSLKSPEILLNTEISLSLTAVKLASSLPSTLIFLEMCRTPREPSQAPWISSERKKPALLAEQPGTRGRLPAHGHDPPRRYRQPGTGYWQHRETIWELEEGQGKPGEVGGQMLWQGWSCGQSPGHRSRACKTCHLSRWLILQFVKPKSSSSNSAEFSGRKPEAFWLSGCVSLACIISGGNVGLIMLSMHVGNRYF